MEPGVVAVLRDVFRLVDQPLVILLFYVSERRKHGCMEIRPDITKSRFKSLIINQAHSFSNLLINKMLKVDGYFLTLLIIDMYKDY